jgi:GAF domain-containing protein
VNDASENLIKVLTAILEKIHATDFSLKVVMETILDYAVDSTKADVGSILLVDKDASALRTVAIRGEMSEREREPRYSFDERSVQLNVFRTAKAQVVSDVNSESEYRSIWAGVRSELAVPILAGSEILGVLNLESRTVDAFEARDAEFGKLIAGQIASALRTQRLRNIDEIARAEREVLSKQTCFVLMPFSDPFNRYYSAVLAPAVESAGLHPLRADTLFGPTNVIRDVWEGVSVRRTPLPWQPDRAA